MFAGSELVGQNIISYNTHYTTIVKSYKQSKNKDHRTKVVMEVYNTVQIFCFHFSLKDVNKMFSIQHVQCWAQTIPTLIACTHHFTRAVL